MTSISEVKTVKDVLERAAQIAAFEWTPVEKNAVKPKDAWLKCHENRIVSALCHPAYPNDTAGSESHTQPWWKDHVRLRGLDVSIQGIVKKTLGVVSMFQISKLTTKEQAVEILTRCAEAA